MYLTEADNLFKNPPIKLLDMKVKVNSSLYLYSTFHREYSSALKWSQNHGRATGLVSSLEYFLFHSSRTKVGLPNNSNGCFGFFSGFGSASSAAGFCFFSSFFGAAGSGSSSRLLLLLLLWRSQWLLNELEILKLITPDIASNNGTEPFNDSRMLLSPL